VTALRHHHILRWLTAALLLGLAFLTTIGWIGIPIPFTSLAQATNLGRSINRYVGQSPELLVIAESEDIEQLAKFLQVEPVPQTGNPPIIAALRRLDYQHSFALLVLQGIGGGSSHVLVQRITRQWNRIIVHAKFVTPRLGEGQTANLTDAYDLVALDTAGLLGHNLHFELWDGWQKLKDVTARVGDLPPQSSPTPLPAPIEPTTLQPSYANPTPAQATPSPPQPYPAPGAMLYSAPATPYART
jgi:hypothetical protein